MTPFLYTLLKLSLLGSLLTGLLLLVRPLIKSKAAVYYLWLLVLVRLVLPVGVTLPLPALPEQGTYQAHTQTEVSLSGQTDPVQIQGQAGEPTGPAAPETPGAPEQPAAPAADWKGVLTAPELWFGLWAAGAGLWLGRYVWGYRRFAALVRVSARPAGQGARNVLAALDPGGRTVVLECIHVHTPMLLGAIHPAIVLPVGVENDRLADILSHELTHARRHDLLYKWLAAAVTSLHWFNPLMVVVRREISRSCELSCDEAVTRTMDGPARKHYGETLLVLAARPPRGMGVLATTLCEEKARLKERLVSIMKGKRQGPAALAATLALAIVLTGCAAISGAAPSPSSSPEPTPDLSALLENPVLYDLDYDLQLAIPSDLDGKLLVELPEEGEDFLVCVWEKRSYEAAGGGDTDMGWLFTLVRWDQATYEQYLISDGSGVTPFGYRDGWYYVWLTASDVRFYSNSQDEAVIQAEEAEWTNLNKRLPEEVRPDFLARNGLEAYEDSMYFHDGYVWESDHRYVYFRTENWGESITLLLSQPIKQGEGGIWCVEGWVDNNYGTRYLVLPRDTGTTAADYYTQLQQQADGGRENGLLDPLSAAREWLSEQGYNVGAGYVELVEGDPAWNIYSREMEPILAGSSPARTLTYENGQETDVETCGVIDSSIQLWVRVWVKAQAPAALNGKAVTCTDQNGDSLIFLEEGGLVGIVRDGETSWYAYAYDYDAPSPYETMYSACQDWLAMKNPPPSHNYSSEEYDRAYETVVQSFETGMAGCTLESSYYDPQQSYEVAADYLHTDDPERINNVIVFFVSFTTDGNQPVLDPNTTYTDYKFILQREDKDSPWVVIDGGY